jgi:hypothetical protein
MASGIADPIARVVSAVFLQPIRRSPDGRGIVVGPDQALGCAATLGLSLAVYRLVAAMMRGGGSGRSVVDADADGPPTSGRAGTVLTSLPSFLLTFLRAALFRKIQDGDPYHRAAYGGGGGGSKKKRDDSAGPDMQHRGSCHCASIRFTVSLLYTYVLKIRVDLCQESRYSLLM